MSTSSTSLEMSLRAFFHSSAKGPVEESFGIVPTFFYTAISVLYRSYQVEQPYSGTFDNIQTFLKMFRILLWILATD